MMYGLTKEKTLKTITCYTYKGKEQIILKVFKRKLKSWRRAWVIGFTWGLENGHRDLSIEFYDEEDRETDHTYCSYSLDEDDFIKNYINYVDKHPQLN